MLGARGMVIYAFGIGANLALASLLTPRDFGLIALGAVFLVFGTYLAEGGFRAALIRREQEPLRTELEAVLGMQLTLTVAVALVVAAASAPFGRDGLVVATMAAALPIAAFRTPSVAVLERRLRYRVIATTDVIEALVYYGWALAAVAAGFGVWGLATGAVARALAGSIMITAMGPVGVVRPRWAWSVVRPFTAFGLKFQGAEALYVAREQGVNVVVAAASGLGVLGVWNLAWRVMQVPNLLFLTVGRVAFTAVSRLLGAGRDVRPAIERGVAVLAVVTGLMVAGLVGLATALPAIVGPDWADVPAVILWSGIALIVASPIGVATRGYLLAADQAATVALAVVLSAAAWFAVSIALLPAIGAPAVGIGWVAAGLVNSALLWRRTAQLTGAAILGSLAGPTTVALLATGCAWLVSKQPNDALVGGLVGFVTGELVALGGLFAVSRPTLLDVRELTRQARASFSRKPSVERSS